MAHYNYLKDEDIQLLTERRAGGVHIPDSNICLKAVGCRVRHLLNTGVKVRLRIEFSAGYSPSILDVILAGSKYTIAPPLLSGKMCIGDTTM